MIKKLTRKEKKIDSFLGKNSTFSGDIFSKCSLFIEGTVEGNVFADGQVIVGKTAFISGNIEAHSSTISGKVKGSIIVKDYTKLTPTGTVDGHIHATHFIADEGSIFNGQCFMHSNDDTNDSFTDDKEV